MMPKMRSSNLTAIGLVLALSAPALAQGNQATPAPASLANTATTPASPANDHSAKPDDYPLLSIALGEQGTTSLAFTIRDDGTTTDIRVEKSSGSVRLDDASVALAKHWLYKPAMQDGKPVAVPWQTNVLWSLRYTADELAAAGILILHPDASDFPAGTTVSGQDALTMVAIVIKPDSVVATKVVQTSGSRALDDAASKIATKAHFTPVTVNGKSVVSTTVVAVDWSQASEK